MELPVDLPPAVFEALANTRISGKLIDIQLDDGPPIRRTREDRSPQSKNRSGGPTSKKSHENRPYPSRAADKADKKPYVKKGSTGETWKKGETGDTGTRKPRHK